MELQPLHLACVIGNEEVVKILIIAGADPKKANYYGFLPIDFAAHFGHRSIMKILSGACGGSEISCLKKEEEESYMDDLIELAKKMTLDNYTPFKCLMMNSEKFTEGLFNFYLQLGAKVNSHNLYGDTVLHIAALYGNEKGVIKLIENGAEVNVMSMSLGAPLHYAAYMGHTRVVEILLERGADYRKKTNMQRTALDIAAGEGYKEIVEIITRHFISSSLLPLPPPLSPLTATTISDWSAEIIKMSEAHSLPLISTAAYHNNTRLIDALEAMGEFVGRKEEDIPIEQVKGLQRAPYHYDPHLEKDYKKNWSYRESYEGPLYKYYPIAQAVICGSAEVVRHLLRKGVQTDIPIEYFEERRFDTLLNTGIYYGHVEVVKEIITKEELERDKYYLLYLACEAGRVEVVEWLHSQGGVDLFSNNINNDDWNPLLVAAGEGHPQLAEYLVKKGLPLEVRGMKNVTPLLCAAFRHGPPYQNNIAVAKLLIEMGADLEATTEEGHTPFLVAANSECKMMLSMLKEKGANIRAKDTNNMGALHMAAKSNMNTMLLLLQYFEGDIEEINRKDNSGCTPIDYALQHSHNWSCVLGLLKAGAMLRDSHDTRMYFAWALHAGQQELVERMLDSGIESLQSKEIQ